MENLFTFSNDLFLNKEFKKNFISDMLFSIAFILVLALFFVAGYRSLKKEENRTQYMVMTIIFLVLTVLSNNIKLYSINYSKDWYIILLACIRLQTSI